LLYVDKVGWVHDHGKSLGYVDVFGLGKGLLELGKELIDFLLCSGSSAKVDSFSVLESKKAYDSIVVDQALGS
jgi:hypothetical protein